MKLYYAPNLCLSLLDSYGMGTIGLRGREGKTGF